MQLEFGSEKTFYYSKSSSAPVNLRLYGEDEHCTIDRVTLKFESVMVE